jgi:hypothetical protein
VNAPPSATAISTTIAQTYGFAPSLAVPIAPFLTYEAINSQLGIVTGVTRLALVSRTDDYPRHLFDQFA